MDIVGPTLKYLYARCRHGKCFHVQVVFFTINNIGKMIRSVMFMFNTFIITFLNSVTIKVY